MRIEALELFHVSMPMVEPWRTAYGEETEIDSVIVRLIADGVEGWAETSPHKAPLFSPECADTAFRLLRDWLGPMVLGQDIASGRDLQERMRPVKGNQFAKAGLDVALWDILAKTASQPMWRFLGGESPKVDAGADLGVFDGIDELARRIEEALTAGFERIKLKYRPGWDLEMIKSVRGRFPSTVFHIDCNSGYTLDDCTMFRELDSYGLAMFEQPLGYDDLVDHAKLQKQVSTPICLDESINSVQRAAHAIELGACRWINIKVGRVGGLTNALAIHDLCRESSIPNWIGNMLESALGQAPSLALATLPNVQYPSDIFPSRRFYQTDLCEPEIELSGPSTVWAPDRPGLGWAPHPRRLEETTVQRASLGTGAAYV